MLRYYTHRNNNSHTFSTKSRKIIGKKKNYSKRFHLDFIKKYKIIGPDNPKIAETIPNPIERFIINAITVLPQNAKKGHFFHINKNITKTTLANATKPYKYHTHGATLG